MIGIITLLHGFGIGAGSTTHPLRFEVNRSDLFAGFLGRSAALVAVATLASILNRRLNRAHILSAKLLENIGDAIVVAEPDGTVIFESPEFRKLANETTIGKKLHDLKIFTENDKLNQLLHIPKDNNFVNVELTHNGTGETKP